MQKKIWILLFILGLVVLSACGKEEENKDSAADSDSLKALNVDLEVPETSDVNAKVEMKAVITYGDEKVTDADEVKFEVWQDGKKEESKLLESTNNNDGTYSAKTTFDTDGVYTIQSHVTARDMHIMPKKTVTVGTGVPPQEKGDTEHAEHAEHEHAQTEGFAMNLMEPDSAQANQESTYTVQLQMEGKPLEQAMVTFEIWTEKNPEKHEWIDAKESEAGQYTGSYAFPVAGKYNLKVHVKNDAGLHEHEVHQVEVK